MGGLGAQAPSAPSGVIRIWGHGGRHGDFAGGLVRRWNEAFQRTHPEVRFEVALSGDSAAMGGLYTGAADIALMGREIWPTEIEGFDQGAGGKPLEISVMTGSPDRPNHSTALGIFVHKDNPLARLTLAQVDAVFGADHRRSVGNMRTWGDLGLTGEWAGHAIDLYGFGIAQDHAQYFERAVMGGSQKWNCGLREFGNDGPRILEALANDPWGMALGSLADAHPLVKALALSAGAGEFIEPTRDNIAQRRYPLARPVSMVIRRPAGTQVGAALRQYLEFILSREGQRIVAEDGGYLPLPEEMAREERRKLQ